MVMLFFSIAFPTIAIAKSEGNLIAIAFKKKKKKQLLLLPLGVTTFAIIAIAIVVALLQGNSKSEGKCIAKRIKSNR